SMYPGRLHGGELMRRRALAVVGLLALAAPPARGDEDALKSLGEALRPILAGALPPVLYEKEYDWGRQRPTASGLEWHGLRARVTKSPRNDGIWRKVRVTAQDPRQRLEFQLSDLRNLDADRQTFKAFLAFPAGIEYEQQTWERGVRLLSTSAEARVRLRLAMECESTFRLEATDKLLPDLVFRLRVVKAELTYDNLVVEHVAGIGGSGARLVG